ncbi:MAG: hypothetical protein O3A01_03535 [bacterium]|nr:hypothetical protein [bacterium]
MIKFFLLFITILTGSMVLTIHGILIIHAQSMKQELLDFRLTVSAYSALSLMKSNADSMPTDALLVWSPFLEQINECRLFGAQMPNKELGKAVCDEYERVVGQAYVLTNGEREYVSHPFIESD